MEYYGVFYSIKITFAQYITVHTHTNYMFYLLALPTLCSAIH